MITVFSILVFLVTNHQEHILENARSCPMKNARPLSLVQPPTDRVRKALPHRKGLAGRSRACSLNMKLYLKDPRPNTTARDQLVILQRETLMTNRAAWNHRTIHLSLAVKLLVTVTILAAVTTLVRVHELGIANTLV